MRRNHLLLAALIALYCGLTLPGPALAQSDTEDEEDQAGQHFAKGRSLYAEGKYKEAIDELLSAFTLRPAPPILLNIGRTYEKIGDKAKALEFYRKYLLKARLVDPNRPQVEALVKKLETETGGKASSSTASTETPDARTTKQGTIRPARARTGQLIHTPVDSAKVRQPISIMAELPPQTEADALWLYFRKQGERRFHRLQMSAQGDAFIAQIPGRYVTTTSLQYYIEAANKDAKRPVAIAGSRITPHIIVIEGGRAPVLGQTPTLEIRSPYRTWFWVSAAGSAAVLGGSLAMALLAKDRASAVEVAGNAKPIETFDRRARDWESQGKTFATMSGVFLGLGIAAAGAAGYLWYLDHKYVKEERSKLDAHHLQTPRLVRFSGAPWAAPGGGGFVGRIDF